MGSLSRPIIPVAIEYDSRGQRVRREFRDARDAKPVWCRLFRQGRNPKLIAL
jgi:hypothetical protein